MSKCQIFDKQDALTVTEVEQESSNLLVTVNRVRGQIFAPLGIEEESIASLTLFAGAAPVVRPYRASSSCFMR